MAMPKSLCQGRYRVQKALGTSVQHPNSVVYECYDPERDARVAVKVLSIASPSPEIAREMFRREVGALDGLEHPFIVQMYRYEAEEDQQRLNIVLELVPGGNTLEHLIAGKASLPVAANLRWRLEQLLGLIQALDKAHGKGIIHRDVKLSNLLVAREEQRLKLVDFGIARILENYGRGNAGATLRDFYTVPFAAPEQVNRRDTSFPADLHAFGVVAVSLLAWHIPTAEFTAGDVAALLEPLGSETGSPVFTTALPDLVRGLLDPNPAARPRAADVEFLLREALDATLERRPLRVVLTTSARTKASTFGAAGQALLDDLNMGLRVKYDPAHDDKGWSIFCLGRKFQARLVPSADEQGKLKMVDVVVPHATDLARRRELSSAAPFMLVEGDGDATPLIEFIYEEHVRAEAARQSREAKQGLLDLAQFILERQRERLELIRVRYRIQQDGDPEPRASAPPPPPPPGDWRAKLAALATPAPAPPRVGGEMTRAAGQFVDVTVLSVRAGRQADVGDAEMADDAIPPEWEDALGPDSTFSFRGRDFGTAHWYDRKTKTLTLKLKRAVSLPPEGEIACEDVATRTALDRQEGAISTYLEDAAVNPRLARLLLHPDENTVEDPPPIELVQSLEPADQYTDIVSRALGAKDMFLVQGPPGTGKTTLITEVVTQILQREPHARILLTSQANEAVSNAMDAVRAMDERVGGRWRLVRDSREDAGVGVPVGFEHAFEAWAKTTRERSKEAENALPQGLAPGRQAAVAAALATWREKLGFIPDVKTDYAASVQVWGMTLLRVPALAKRLPEVRFDHVIIDEAARATPAELMVALVTGRRFLLVGDHRQLPPFLDTEDIDDLRRAGLDEERARRAFFEDLFDRVGDGNRATLRRQFRMHRSIGDFVGTLYYEDIGLETGVADSDRILALNSFGGDHRVFWLDVQGRELQLPDSTSWWNPDECAAIDALLQRMEGELREFSGQYTVGIIAAYGDQRHKLREKVRPDSKRWQKLRIRINTVDAFQGKQDDIMVYSNVRANTTELRFVSDERRLNVAFSRAKRLLVIVGHRETAIQSPQIKRAVALIPPANILKAGGGK